MADYLFIVIKRKKSYFFFSKLVLKAVLGIIEETKTQRSENFKRKITEEYTFSPFLL